MLIFNGTDWVQFVGTRPVALPDVEDVVVFEPCVSTGPLGGHDTVARVADGFRACLTEFLADPDSSYVDGTASMWRMRLARASGGVL